MSMFWIGFIVGLFSAAPLVALGLGLGRMSSERGERGEPTARRESTGNPSRPSRVKRTPVPQKRTPVPHLEVRL